MNLRHLEIFCAVMRCRTTVAAAFELHVSQPAISIAIKQLEARLGLTLFQRAGKHLVPTAEAEVLYHDAQPLYAMSQAISGKLRDLRDTKRGYLRVLATHALGRPLIAPAIAQFVGRRSQVMVYFDVSPMEGVVESVESGFASLGFALVPAHRPGLQVDVLGDCAMVVVMPRGHKLAKLRSVKASDLRGEPLIGLEPASRIGHLARQVFSDADMPYAPTLEVRHCATACSLVEQGLGISVVDEFSCASSSGWQLEARPLAPAITLSLVAMSAKDRPLSRLAASFVQEVRKVQAGRLAASSSRGS
jgi:DNA-binding transcriptional LysR family regulator